MVARVIYDEINANLSHDTSCVFVDFSDEI
jgi:hypothetical protein